MKRLLLLVCILMFLTGCACADLAVHFLDVGHGDCSIITCDGQTMVIDGGSPSKSDAVYSYLKKHGISHVQAVVGTHPDADHIGGLPAVFHACSVDALYVPIADHPAKKHATLMEKAAEMGVPVIIPEDKDSFLLGNAVVTLYRPTMDDVSDNNMSIVVRLSYGSHVFLFCADIDKDAEWALMDGDYDLRADVLKVAHHGSDASSSIQFLQAVNARYAVISGNSRYASPKDEVPSKIIAVGANLLHTLQNRNIVVATDGENLTVSADRYYVGNAKSHIFHTMNCRHVANMSAQNMVFIYAIEQAKADAYSPCKTCNPK